MRGLRTALLAMFFLGLLLRPAFAMNWLTKIEDDVLTDGKSATLLGEVSASQLMYLTCRSDGEVSVAYVERGKFEAGMDAIPFKMVLRADKGAKHWLDVTAYAHNAEFIGFKNEEDKSTIFAILKDIRDGKSKLDLGLTAEIISFKWSGSTRLRGSTTAVKKFVSACGIDLE